MEGDSGSEREHPLNGDVAREILRGCVFSRTRMLDRVLSRLFDDSLAPLGVRGNQLTVLALLGAMEGLRAADVGPLPGNGQVHGQSGIGAATVAGLGGGVRGGAP